tara:strand:- start:1160 stop:1831 length:672 start_codon:yes stop_codon:yes gene_type:complete
MDYFIGLIIGGFTYTFLEYLFHRYLLHTYYLKFAHENHHRHPTKLKIITTPLIPAQIIIFSVIAIISFISVYWANLVLVGMSISQLIMDYVHYLEHSSFNSWFLVTAKSYHKLHHGKFNYNKGFGLTCPFWDSIFNTSVRPNKEEKYIPWELYVKYPFLYYTQIPLPMISFILWTPFMDKTYNDNSAPFPDIKDVKLHKLFIAFLLIFITGNSPYFSNLFIIM